MGTDPLPVKNGRYIKHVCIGEFGGHIDGCLTSGGGGVRPKNLVWSCQLSPTMNTVQCHHVGVVVMGLQASK